MKKIEFSDVAKMTDREREWMQTDFIGLAIRDSILACVLIVFGICGALQLYIMIFKEGGV